MLEGAAANIMLNVSIRTGDYARKVALLALTVCILEEIISAGVMRAMTLYPSLHESILLPVATLLSHWILPFAVVFLVEKKGLRALGFAIRKDHVGRYMLYAFIGLVIPALILGVGQPLFIDLIEQIVQIGLAEEVFFRGYLLQRLVEWLGERGGLVLGALAFGLAHIGSRVSQHGLEYPLHDATLGFQMFLGGLVMGAIYIRAGNLLPGSILHVGANLYLDKIITLLGG